MGREGKGRIAQRTAKPRLPPRPQRLLLADNAGGELLAGDFSHESGATEPGGRRPNDPAGHDGVLSLQHTLSPEPPPLGSARLGSDRIGSARLGPSLGGAHWADGERPAVRAPRLAVSPALYACPRPVGGSAPVGPLLIRAQGLGARLRTRGDATRGSGWARPRGESVPASAAPLRRGNEARRTGPRC